MHVSVVESSAAYLTKNRGNKRGDSPFGVAAPKGRLPFDSVRTEKGSESLGSLPNDSFRSVPVWCADEVAAPPAGDIVQLLFGKLRKQIDLH